MKHEAGVIPAKRRAAPPFTSPRRGEVGSRREPGEGITMIQTGFCPFPSPHPSPQRGEGVARGSRSLTSSTESRR